MNALRKPSFESGTEKAWRKKSDVSGTISTGE